MTPPHATSENQANSGMQPRGVTATIAGQTGTMLFHGAAVLRPRPHPISGIVLLHLGVPDAALGFRPRRGDSYRIAIARDESDEHAPEYTAREVWLERVQSSWWFVLEAVGDERAVDYRP